MRIFLINIFTITTFEVKYSLSNYIPLDFTVDGGVDNVGGQEVGGEQHDGLHRLALHQPQLNDGRCRCPVRPHERDHRKQSGQRCGQEGHT